ncbi:MAG TPA: sialidase family protein [Anaeromyxobacter sp.]|nr:sialidase family protein [Anaeromyxobacter sp.]
MRASGTWWLALWAAGIATGCVAPAVRPGKVAPGPGDGVILLSVTWNSANVLGIDVLDLERVDPGHGGIGVQVSGQQLTVVGSRDTSLLVGALPAGEYRITGFQGSVMAWHKAAMTFTKGIWLPARAAIQPDPESAPPGVFRVVPGAVHDLGRVVMSMNAGERHWVWNDAVSGNPLRSAIGRSVIATSNADLVRRFSPENARLLEGTLQRGWVAPRDADDRVEENARSRPGGPLKLGLLSSGEAVAVGRMGAFMIRDRSGRWSVSSSPGLESFLCLVPVGPGAVRSLDGVRAVAVGEFNAIAALDGTGRVRRLSPGNLPPGNLIFVEGDDGQGWTVALVARGAVTFYRSPMLEHGSWTAIRTEPFASSSSAIWVWPARGGFGYANTEGALRVYDRKSGIFVEHQGRPGAERILSLAYFPGAGIGVLTGSWYEPGHYFSRDDGRTWVETRSTFKVQKAPPQYTSQGQLLVMGADRIVDPPVLRATKDGGATWEDLAEELPQYTDGCPGAAGRRAVPAGKRRRRRGDVHPPLGRRRQDVGERVPG